MQLRLQSGGACMEQDRLTFVVHDTTGIQHREAAGANVGAILG